MWIFLIQNNVIPIHLCCCIYLSAYFLLLSSSPELTVPPIHVFLFWWMYWFPFLAIMKNASVYIHAQIFVGVYVSILVSVKGSFQDDTSGKKTKNKKTCLPMQEVLRDGFDPWVRKVPWRRKWQPPPVVLPRESHGQSSLAGYCP